MYVRVWDRMAQALEWRLVVFVDREWILTDSLLGGTILRFSRVDGVSERDDEIKLDPRDRNRINAEYAGAADRGGRL